MARLENDIKQNSFKSEMQKLAVNIMFTHGWLISHQKTFFDKYNISGQQYNVLRILRGQHPNPVSINILKERMLDKMSDASRLVERLRLKGFTKRSVCKNDRRKLDVVITNKGLKLLKELDKFELNLEKLFFNLKSSEVKQLNNLLDKLRG